MKLVQINLCPDGSTGTIMLQIAETARRRGWNTFSYSRKWRNQPPAPDGHSHFGSFPENAIHQILGDMTGYSECFSCIGTRNLIRKLKTISPDVIHLHNLHGWYIDLPQLFRYIKRNRIRVIWTLHDCWAFTGGCPHFTMAKCDRWKTGCFDCTQYRQYPASRVDRTKRMWKLKKEWFTGVEDMTIVTPSRWLADLVKQSYLREYPVTVINNGIDLSVFNPKDSDFRKRYHCEDKYILLGVAAAWGKRKGLDVFGELSKRLEDSYQIVLVGTTEATDAVLPENVISISRTSDLAELAAIYSAADVFVNPTREDNFPTVNLEALACGTPVITFRTGGSPECLDTTCGSVVPVDDVGALETEIRRIVHERPFSKEACVRRAGLFDKNEKFKEYVDLYENSSYCSECSV